MSYGITEAGTLGVKSIEASGNGLYKVKETILSGEGILAAGCVLGKVTASGKLKAWLDTAIDGSEVIYGVLAEDVDATSADVLANVYVHGEFITDNLTAAATQVISDGAFKYGNLIFKSEA